MLLTRYLVATGFLSARETPRAALQGRRKRYFLTPAAFFQRARTVVSLISLYLTPHIPNLTSTSRVLSLQTTLQRTMGPPVQAQPQPVSPEELYSVVCGAASQNPSEVQASTTRLKELLERPGAYDILHEIAAQKSVPLQVRQQAMIQFKNATTGHWRSRK